LAKGHVPTLVNRVIQRKCLAEVGVQAFLIPLCASTAKCNWVENSGGVFGHKFKRATFHATVHGSQGSVIVSQGLECNVSKTFRRKIGAKHQKLSMIVLP
jgi:hypothetical protein